MFNLVRFPFKDSEVMKNACNSETEKWKNMNSLDSWLLFPVLFRGTLYQIMVLLLHTVRYQRKVCIKKQFPEAAPGQPRFRVPIGSSWVFLFAFSCGHDGSEFQWPCSSLTEAKHLNFVFAWNRNAGTKMLPLCVYIFTSYLLDVFVPAMGTKRTPLYVSYKVGPGLYTHTDQFLFTWHKPGHILEKRNSTKESPLSDWPVDTFVGPFSWSVIDMGGSSLHWAVPPLGR